ncbi:MAG: hypothetical protein HQL76_06865 [Magnetococcales bacterium]|nr:hypothetical protein [Magnetococcales bacterium]
MSNLDRTELTLEAIRSNLSSNPDALIESYLAQYLTVVFHSEIEEKVTLILRSRLAAKGDEKLSKFIVNTATELIKRTKKTDIRKLVERFGNDAVETFDRSITDEEVSYYSSIITARHITSHSRNASVTIKDIERGVKSAKKILSSLEMAII